MHVDVRILKGSTTDSRTLAAQRENQKDCHPRSEEVEEGVSNGENDGCELQQMTTKTDNELSLGSVGG